LLKNFQVLRLQAVITLQGLQMSKTHGLMIPRLVSIFTVRINSVFLLGCTLRTSSPPTKRFRAFDYILMLSITQQYWVTWYHVFSNAVSKTAYYGFRYKFRYGAAISLKIDFYRKVEHNSISHYW